MAHIQSCVTDQQKHFLILLKKGYELRNVKSGFKNQWMLLNVDKEASFVSTEMALSLLDYIKLKDEFVKRDYVINKKGKKAI